MRAVPRTAPTIIPVILPEGLLSEDGRDEKVARRRLGEDDEVILDEGIATEDEKLAVFEDFVAKDAVAVGGGECIISPPDKKTPFL